ncbi:MAG: copper-translocating P-type ATPase, partial [Lachnospiraceae bacterium]|nr:copper-translocating P-type ATPase [Lachnospiraceae bacterium]
MDQYTITGMSCAACQARVEKAVSKVPGVSGCNVSLLTNTMGVEGTASPEEIIAAVENAGYGAAVKGGAGRHSAAGSRMAQAGSSASGSENAALAASDVTGGGSSFRARIAAEEDALKDRETPKLRSRLLTSLGFLLVLMYFSMGHMMFHAPLPRFFTDNPIAVGIVQMLLAGIVMVINQKFFISGFKSLFHGAPNMDTLIALGSGAAFIYSSVMLLAMTRAQADGNSAAVSQYMMEFYFESAAMILTLITVGKMLEAYSTGNTTSALKSLMKLAPQTATLLRDGQEVTVPIDDVHIGDTFVVRPGENIPVDGLVLEGTSAVNEASLTGESIPVDKAPGDPVSSATLNQSGFLTCEATRVGEDTTLAKIISMVSDAAATKAPVAKLADTISGYFVPVVIGIALITTLIWLLIGRGAGFSLARGICVLVVSCPCALGLATPVAIMVGNGVGARNGILFKTAQALQETGNVQIVALDKTGTITNGEPVVVDIIPAEGFSNEDLMVIAGSLEEKSEHPLSIAITSYVLENAVSYPVIQDFQAIPGKGLMGVWAETSSTAHYGNSAPSANASGENSAITANAFGGNSASTTTLYGGNSTFISQYAVIPPEMKTTAHGLASDGKTPLFFAKGNRLAGIIAVADTMKEDSAAAISQMKKLGIHVVMLTGDNEETANAIGREAGVNEVVAGVLPDGKEAIIRALQEKGKVAMVGDGINDAPALTRADIGIAIGAGTDVALDAADVVLMKSSLADVAGAIRLSRQTYKNILENLFWALIYNTLLIPIAAGALVRFGITMDPMFGAAAMSLSSFCVVSNALRLNLFKLYDASGDRPPRYPVIPDENGHLLAHTNNKTTADTPTVAEKACEARAGAETTHNAPTAAEKTCHTGAGAETTHNASGEAEKTCEASAQTETTHNTPTAVEKTCAACAEEQKGKNNEMTKTLNIEG